MLSLEICCSSITEFVSFQLNWAVFSDEQMSDRWPPFPPKRSQHREGGSRHQIEILPSRERIHIPPGEKENHRLKHALSGGHVSSQEGMFFVAHLYSPPMGNIVTHRIHVWYIFSYVVYHTNSQNVGKYTIHASYL